MSLTLLFDLDDTLLDTHLEAFIPAYFQGLSQHLAGRVSPELMLKALMGGTRLMMNSEDPAQTLQQVFEAIFYPKLGIPKDDLLPLIEQFYDEVFPSLGSHTGRRPEAVPLIEWAFAHGHRVAIATNPLFPRKATHHRLRWAGFDPARFELVSTFEDFHFSKTYPAYYAEVLGRLGWPEGAVLVVGNDRDLDIVNAHRLGLKTYWVDGQSVFRPGPEAGRGTLADLRPWLEAADLSALEPSYGSPDAILGILGSTPAVLKSLTASLTEERWRSGTGREDWAMNELVCHLRDTEREIHAMQIRLMLERDGAFIPRPDSAVWASERDYLHVDGATALAEFVSARLHTLQLLKGLEQQVWARTARHAIFGPTDFREVIGFMADHDRMHVQQAWKILKRLPSARVQSAAGVL